MVWDVFICHASEDKEEFARPLVEELRRQAPDLQIWYDEFELTLGDSLRQKIDYGLAHSRFGIVVLSPQFFRKRWPQQELDGLAAREEPNRKIILPVWYQLGRQEILEYSPLLADRLAVSSSLGLKLVANSILHAIRKAAEVPSESALSMSLRRRTTYIASFILLVAVVLAALGVFWWHRKQEHSASSLTSPDAVLGSAARLQKDLQDAPSQSGDPHLPSQWGSDTEVQRGAEMPGLTNVSPPASARIVPQDSGAADQPPPVIPESRRVTGAIGSRERKPLHTCTTTDLRLRDGSVLAGVQLECGPKDGGVITVAEQNFRFATDVTEIQNGEFPERVLSFDRLQSVEFGDLNPTETAAAEAYYTSRSDFFKRKWRAVRVRFFDGHIWDRIYIYDNCTFDSTYERGSAFALNLDMIIFKQEPDCRSETN